MDNGITVINIREFLGARDDQVFGEEELKKVLSDFCCNKNPDVEKFLKKQSIEFTKKNQSVTYLVFSDIDAELLGYFTITIKPICVHAENFSNTIRRKLARVSEFDKNNSTYMLSAYLVAQLGKNFIDGIDDRIHGNQLLQIAIDTIKELQYIVGGMVVFVEAEDNEKLIHFYEAENGFKRFDTKDIRSDTDQNHTLVQLLRVL